MPAAPDVQPVSPLSPSSPITAKKTLQPAKDAFDADNFNAIAYINEMFPTGVLHLYLLSANNTSGACCSLQLCVNLEN